MEATRSQSPPPILEYLRPEDSFYNFGILESENEDGSPKFDYECVLVTNPPSKEKIKQAVSFEYNLSDWQDLIDQDCNSLGIPDTIIPEPLPTPVPSSITQLQGKLQLDILGLYSHVEAMIEQSGTQAKIYWNTAVNWERSSPILNRLAPLIWPTDTENKLDEFFINASKLS